MLCRICISENGYNDNVLALDILKYFDEQTCEKANGRYRRLFVDGFKSHMTLAFLQYAVKHKIVIVCYPPHCTHVLQGLDVVVFARIKTLWGELLKELQRKEITVDKYNFLQWYSSIRDQAITADNCQAAFKVTGIRPFCPSIVTSSSTMPSLAHSTESTGLFNQLPAEWQDIRDALRTNRIRRSQSLPSLSGTSQVEYSDSDALELGMRLDNENSNGIDNAEELEGNEADTESQYSTVIAHLNRAVEGSVYTYIADQDEPTFSSQTSVPDVFVSPHHHCSPHHSQYLQPTNPELLETTDELQAHLRSAYQHIVYLEGKVDNLETNLFVIHQYAGAAQQKLYRKETKPRKESEKLFANGKRALTDSEYMMLREAEEYEKETETRLKNGYRQWRETEQKERKIRNEGIDKEWREFRANWAKERGKKRPPQKKPALLKREATPEVYWVIRKKRRLEDGREGGDDGDSERSDGDD